MKPGVTVAAGEEEKLSKKTSKSKGNAVSRSLRKVGATLHKFFTGRWSPSARSSAGITRRAENVSHAADVRAAHAADKWFASREPDVVVFARTTEACQRGVKVRESSRLPVTPRGSGYGYVGGCVPASGGIALSVARMIESQEIHERTASRSSSPG